MSINVNSAQQPLAILLTNTDPKERLVIYYGICEVLASAAIKKSQIDETIRTKSDTLIFLNSELSKICELAICDRTLLESIARKIFEFQYSKELFDSRVKNIFTWKCLNDVIGVSNCYSAEDIFIINQKFDVYRNALMVTNDYVVNTLKIGTVVKA